jgi:hypothetical protein
MLALKAMSSIVNMEMCCVESVEGVVDVVMEVELA